MKSTTMASTILSACPVPLLRMLLALLALHLLLLATRPLCAAHTVFTTLYVDDVSQGDGTCVRMPMDAATAADPIADLAGTDMACGRDGTHGVARVCAVTQGASLGFRWREVPDGSSDGIIDASHLGPCAVFMKAVDDPTKDSAIGGGWFKIWESPSPTVENPEWCTTNLIRSHGILNVTLPENLAGGYYLVRPSILALHQADKTPPDPQFYVGCAQIYLDSTAHLSPQSTVNIPGYVSISDASVLFNVWEPHWPYPNGEPSVFDPRSGKTTAVQRVQYGESQQVGLLPANAILTEANWWALEVDRYDDEPGCWNASRACSTQTTACYARAPPTGSKNCHAWEDRCTQIRNACNAGDYHGPPDPSTLLRGMTALGANSSVASSVVKSPTRSAMDVSMAKATEAPMHNSASMTVSEDATCGRASKSTCKGSSFGSCCSPHGWCGNSSDYCGEGCQADFGRCA